MEQESAQISAIWPHAQPGSSPSWLECTKWCLVGLSESRLVLVGKRDHPRRWRWKLRFLKAQAWKVKGSPSATSDSSSQVRGLTQILKGGGRGSGSPQGTGEVTLQRAGDIIPRTYGNEVSWSIMVRVTFFRVRHFSSAISCVSMNTLSPSLGLRSLTSEIWGTAAIPRDFRRE